MSISEKLTSCASCCNYRFGERKKDRSSGKYSSWCAILKQGVSPYGIPCMAFIQKREEGRDE